MNAMTPSPIAGLPREPFDQAAHEVNGWRGRCLNAFTRGESAVTECLLSLSTVPGRDGLAALPHLLGHRFDALATAVGADGPFAPEGRSATAALARFREHSSLRNMLCHGVTEITLDQRCRWTVVLRLVALRPGRVDRDVLVIQKEEAERLAADVTNSSNSLRSRLANMINSLSVERVAIAGLSVTPTREAQSSS